MAYQSGGTGMEGIACSEGGTNDQLNELSVAVSIRQRAIRGDLLDKRIFYEL